MGDDVQMMEKLAAIEEATKAQAKYSRALARAEKLLAERDSCIRHAYGRGASLGDIGTALGLSRPNVSRIVNYK